MRARILGLGALGLLLIGALLIGGSVALFFLYASHFSEGYDGSWDTVVLDGAWFAFYGGVFFAAAGVIALLLAALRMAFARGRSA